MVTTKPFLAFPPSRQAGSDQVHVWSVRQFRDIERVLKGYQEEIRDLQARVAVLEEAE